MSAITHCIAVWGTASASNLEKLETSHAKAAKIIYNIKELFYRRQVLTWMHQIYYETCPSSKIDNSVKKSGRLSNPLQFVVPRYHSEIQHNPLN